MTNITKLRKLLRKNNEAATYDNSANDSIIRALPALLDRLEKLEAVAEAAHKFIEAPGHDYCEYTKEEYAALHALGAVLAALGDDE